MKPAIEFTTTVDLVAEYVAEFAIKQKKVRRLILLLNIIRVFGVLMIIVGVFSSMWIFFIGISTLGATAGGLRAKEEAKRMLKNDPDLEKQSSVVYLTINENSLVFVEGAEQLHFSQENFKRYTETANYYAIEGGERLIIIPKKDLNRDQKNELKSLLKKFESNKKSRKI